MNPRSKKPTPPLNHEALAARLLAAQAIACGAGQLARRFLANQTELRVELKAPQDFVSNADRAVEQFIVQRLSAAFPGDAILGEEAQADRPADPEMGIWVIDPIDGTANFVRGRPEWCVSIGFLYSGRPTIGAIFHPASGELYSAQLGRGATRNGLPIRVSDRRSFVGAMLALEYSGRTPISGHLERVERLLAAGGEYRRNGSAALSLAYVADGRFDGFVEAHLNAWDVLAGIVLVSEAGGWTSDFFGSDGLHRGGPLVASSHALRDQFVIVVDQAK